MVDSTLYEDLDNRALADAVIEELRCRKGCSLDQSRISSDANAYHAIAFTVWESSAFLCRGGFLQLLEQNASLTECAKAYDAIGLSGAASIIREASAFIPEKFHRRPTGEVAADLSDWSEEESVYDQMRQFDHTFFDLTTGNILPDAVGRYLRTNRDQFID